MLNLLLHDACFSMQTVVLFRTSLAVGPSTHGTPLQNCQRSSGTAAVWLTVWRAEHFIEGCSLPSTLPMSCAMIMSLRIFVLLSISKQCSSLPCALAQ